MIYTCKQCGHDPASWRCQCDDPHPGVYREATANWKPFLPTDESRAAPEPAQHRSAGE